MDIEAFILAGGRSSRLGRDKAFERVGGRTLAERAVLAVRDASIASKICFVAGNSLETAMEARRLDVDFVFDLVEGRGPLGGIYTALASATTEWIFVLACDLPFVSAKLVKQLSKSIDDGHGAVIPEQPDGRLQPLCAFYNKAAASTVVGEIVARPRPVPPMHEVAAMLEPRIVKPAEYAAAVEASGEPFANVNTEDDLNAARELAGGQTDPISGS